MNLLKLRHDLGKFSNKQQAKILQGFFKTGPGEYAQGDIFLGVKVPLLRSLAKQCQELAFNETLKLLKSPIHEERFLSLLILMLKYRQSHLSGQKRIYKAYLKHSRYINNWDLVDVSAKHIIGDFLANRDRKTLYQLAKSGSLWERRIAILSTFHFIENNDFRDTLKIAKILITDSHDLMHKAVGWMLREVGKRDVANEERFLKKYCRVMPRTMLRYAIERFPDSKRQQYLRGFNL
jgi:3-methyladenine DNA glycosylase AlkD